MKAKKLHKMFKQIINDEMDQLASILNENTEKHLHRKCRKCGYIDTINRRRCRKCNGVLLKIKE